MIRSDALTAARFDDDGTVDALLFLEPGVRVVPVSASVAQRKFEHVGAASLDGFGGQVGHTIHGIRDEEAVPVQAGLPARQVIVHSDARQVALAEAQGRAGYAAVDGERGARLASELDFGFRDRQIVFNGHCQCAGSAKGENDEAADGAEFMHEKMATEWCADSTWPARMVRVARC